MVTGQAPITLERKIAPGGKRVIQNVMHTITETNRTPGTSDKNKNLELHLVPQTKIKI